MLANNQIEGDSTGRRATDKGDRIGYVQDDGYPRTALKMPRIVAALSLQLLIAGRLSALDIVVDGQAATAIVIPNEALDVVEFAADELQYHLEKATGVEVPIRQELDADAGAAGLIFLGACRRTAAVGIETDNLPPNAFRLHLLDGNLFFAGHDSPGKVVGVGNSPNAIHASFVRLGTLFAVYEFLEAHLGVRWLWPGELGEFIPRRDAVAVAEWDQIHIPQIVHARVRDYYNTHFKLWQTPAAARKFYREQSIWWRRHRYALGVDVDYGHGFEDYWEKYGQSHPEYFALAPDGTREPKTVPRLIQMNVAEPALWERIIDRWRGRDRLSGPSAGPSPRCAPISITGRR